jgi:hypothetical protein
MLFGLFKVISDYSIYLFKTPDLLIKDEKKETEPIKKGIIKYEPDIETKESEILSESEIRIKNYTRRIKNKQKNKKIKK